MTPKTAQIYLDANATEPLRPEAREAVLQALDLVGNPSSIHGAGRAARKVLESARASIARGLGAESHDLVFTSGGTEANALAVASLAADRHVIYAATEHDCVRASAGKVNGMVLPVLRSGQADLAALADVLRRTGPALVCLMLANNETGVLNPVAEAASLCHAHGALLHVDAVQAAGRIAVSLPALGADSLAVSAHKMGGPKGAGALVLAPGMNLVGQVVGGGQELGRRGGTQALPAIAGFAAAFEAAGRGSMHISRLRDRAEAEAVAAGAIVCGVGERLPNTTCLAWPGRRADTQVIALDLAGIAVSAGSACSSGKVARSHVLEAMGLPELAGCAIRVSLPWNVMAQDIDRFIAVYTAQAARMRAA